ncbi:MAG: carbon-nitrogen hydrolase family protein [Armatimonadetes bacterium]|nr:carbon-nitrogen hydrolase family protein [Armatimonadota bacterium]
MRCRIGAIQPRRVDAVVATLAEKEPEAFRDWQKRLDVRVEEYDARLQRRVLAAYVDHLCGLLHQAGQTGCDLVLLPEAMLPVGDLYPAGRERLAEACRAAEPLWLERTAPIARQYQMLIASCYYRAVGDQLYNDGVLMDETGAVVGIYHKVHLPCPLDWEAREAGLLAAGDAHPVFETRVGRVGFQICYDIDFPEGCRCLALNGAEIILHPTVGYAFPDEEEVVGEARLRTRATDNSVVLVYSNFGPAPGRSAIYAPNGNQVACCGRGADLLVFADLDPSQPWQQDWGVCVHDHRDQLARKRRPDTYGVLTALHPPCLADAVGPQGRLYEYPAEVGLP